MRLRAPRAPRWPLDAADVLCAAGLLIMTGGIAKLSVAWAMIIGGAVLVALGLAGATRRTR